MVLKTYPFEQVLTKKLYEKIQFVQTEMQFFKRNDLFYLTIFLKKLTKKKFNVACLSFSFPFLISQFTLNFVLVRKEGRG